MRVEFIAAGRTGRADQTVERVRPQPGCYGDPVVHVGPSGAGQQVKLVNTALFAAQIGLLAESIRLGERVGVPESTLLAAPGHGSAASRVLNLVAAGVPSRRCALDDVIETLDIAKRV